MKNDFTFESILVPYNATKGAKRGLKAGISLARKVNGQITLITCIEPQSIFSFFKRVKARKNEEKKVIEEELTKIEARTKLEKPISHIILETSFAPSAISDYARKNNIDLVIIGQTKFLGTEGIYHESMANYLVRSLKCPLMVIK